MSGLNEAAVYLSPGSVNIDDFIKVAKPRALAAGDLQSLRREQRRAESMNLPIAAKVPPISFAEWHDNNHPVDWKIAWWEEGDATFAQNAILEAKNMYGTPPDEFMPCLENQIVEGDWLLCIELEGQAASLNVMWMSLDFVVRVDPTDTAYEPEYPFHAIQVHPPRHYRPPFKLTSEFKRAFREEVTRLGIDNLRSETDLKPTSQMLTDLSNRLRPERAL
jgi:hypothetical protein